MFGGGATPDRDDEGHLEWRAAVRVLCGGVPTPGKDALRRMRTGENGLALEPQEAARSRQSAARVVAAHLDKAAAALTILLTFIERRLRSAGGTPDEHDDEGPSRVHVTRCDTED